MAERPWSSASADFDPNASPPLDEGEMEQLGGTGLRGGEEGGGEGALCTRGGANFSADALIYMRTASLHTHPYRTRTHLCRRPSQSTAAPGVHTVRWCWGSGVHGVVDGQTSSLWWHRAVIREDEPEEWPPPPPPPPVPAVMWKHRSYSTSVTLPSLSLLPLTQIGCLPRGSKTSWSGRSPTSPVSPLVRACVECLAPLLLL